MGKKYSLIRTNRDDLFQIVAEKDFGNVKKGDIGGYVSNEDNLSQIGNCWVDDDSKVIGDARVSGNAIIDSSSYVEGKSIISGEAHVTESFIRGRSYIHGSPVISGSSVDGDILILDHTRIEESQLLGAFRVSDYAQIKGTKMCIYNGAISGEACITPEHPYYWFSSGGEGSDSIVAYTTTENRLRVNYQGRYLSLKQYENIINRRLFEPYKLRHIAFLETADILFPDRGEDEEVSVGYYSILYDEVELFKGKEVYRIRSNRDFYVGEAGLAVHVGDLGGYIRKEDNLREDSWIFDDSIVCDNSRVENCTCISQKSIVTGDSIIDYSDITCTRVNDSYLSAVKTYDCFLADLKAEDVDLFQMAMEEETEVIKENAILDLRLGDDHIYAYKDKNGKVISKIGKSTIFDERYASTYMKHGQKVLDLINNYFTSEE